MKLAALIFFALLASAHQVCGLDRPMLVSMCSFREGEAPWLGYSLFFAIAVVAGIYAIDLKRFGKTGDAVRAEGFAALLVIVAATPAWWVIHNACAIVLLVSAYWYFAGVLYGRSWTLMVLHMAFPFVLIGATWFQGYGIWQKGMICYFVAAAAVHHHVVMREARARIGAGVVESAPPTTIVVPGRG